MFKFNIYILCLPSGSKVYADTVKNTVSLLLFAYKIIIIKKNLCEKSEGIGLKKKIFL